MIWSIPFSRNNQHFTLVNATIFRNFLIQFNLMLSFSLFCLIFSPVFRFRLILLIYLFSSYLRYISNSSSVILQLLLSLGVIIDYVNNKNLWTVIILVLKLSTSLQGKDLNNYSYYNCKWRSTEWRLLPIWTEESKHVVSIKNCVWCTL